jgi:broad specificity phosphatase PhoE
MNGPKSGWRLFHDGCPGGESPEDVGARADRCIARVSDLTGDILAFSSGHIIRMIAARWLGLPPVAGKFFYCRPRQCGRPRLPTRQPRRADHLQVELHTAAAGVKRLWYTTPGSDPEWNAT